MNKKKILSSFFIMLGFFVFFQSMAFASTNTDDSEALYNQKLRAHEELIKNGDMQKLDAEIEQYYKTYGDKVITSQTFANAAPEEKTQLAKEIENRDSALNKSLLANDKSVTSASSHGSNTMSWNAFDDGDIVLVHDGIVAYGYFRHDGTYSKVKGKCITSQISDVGNGKGVIYEPKSWYNLQYDVAAGYSTSNYNSTTRSNVMSFLDAQLGEPYSLVSSYDNWDKWSCCKLPWVGWFEKANINICVDILTGDPLTKAEGIPVPDSIAESPNVFSFAYGS